MKKAISLLLVSVMLLAFAPAFTASALTEQEWQKGTNPYVPDDYRITITPKSSDIVTQNVVTVDEGGELVIADGAVLTVSGEKGRLVNKGVITIKNGGMLVLNGGARAEGGAALPNKDNGALYNTDEGVINIEPDGELVLGASTFSYNAGKINSVSNVVLNGGLDDKGSSTLARLYHLVKVPVDFDRTYSAAETFNRQDMTIHFDVKCGMYKEGDDDLAYLNTEEVSVFYDIDGVNVNEVWVENGNELFILITPSCKDHEGWADWVDTGRMQLYIDGAMIEPKARLDSRRGVFSIKPTGAVDASKVVSTNYKNIVKLFKVELPSTQGYYVITRDGDIERAYVEYGKTLTFRVVVNEQFDKSDVYVYVNTYYLEPDEYGYYDVTGPLLADGMAATGGVQDDLDIRVLGVAPNERLEMMNSIVGFVKEIFDVIKSIFEYFTDIFGAFGGTASK